MFSLLKGFILVFICINMMSCSTTGYDPRRLDLRQIVIDNTEVSRDRLLPFRDDDYPFDKMLYSDKDMEVSFWTDGKRFMFELENKSPDYITILLSKWEYIDPNGTKLKVVGADVFSKDKILHPEINVLSTQKRQFWFTPIYTKEDQRKHSASIFTSGLFRDEDYDKMISINAVFKLKGGERNFSLKFWVGETGKEEK